MKKQPALTYEQALEQYFGGVHGLNQQTIPFTCSCGKSQTDFYKKNTGGLPKLKVEYIMTVDDCFKHIRHAHRERIKAVTVGKESKDIPRI